MKLFAKASKERRLFEKKAAPKNFYCFLSMICFQTASKDFGGGMAEGLFVWMRGACIHIAEVSPVIPVAIKGNGRKIHAHVRLASIRIRQCRL
ncbi:hypothetical protein [Komagataeibacter swingsii]|uniref:hypothetical protein n=1 Tax=Komagataeibacter swingsii TaxID=215220 RepID=UPI001ABEFCBF|nr:hypothetical protein [Komagataeibacter swingsii]